ncbi:ABC transporter substrate-binding protein [Roseobacter sp. CCS2]|uniref:ABC transporter substrate-binding protein n=1 Tax=Roseobacter sp. CCS2 TaxID=391593 RepID=UPI0018DE2FD8|nr:ABC transporter substrate-binding protein [Roseobacter sp. CCS2]
MKIRNLMAVTGLVFAATPALALDCDEGMRAFTHDAGETCIPVDPQRIIAFDEQGITAPLYELGAPIVGSVGRIDVNYNDGEPYLRSLLDVANVTFENSDMSFIGNWRTPDLEVIAGLQPDLIIILDFSMDLYDQLSAVAPVVVVPESDPMLDNYRMIADAVGRLDAFEEGLAAYERSLEFARGVLATTIDDPSDVTVAFVEPTFDEGIWVTREQYTLTQVINDLGFSQPQLVLDSEDPWSQISAEVAQQIDSDFMITTYTNIYEGDFAFDKAEAFEQSLPGWREFLHAPQNGQVILANREFIRPAMFQTLDRSLAIIMTNIVTKPFVPFEEPQ